jgi:hypothetical protein
VEQVAVVHLAALTTQHLELLEQPTRVLAVVVEAALA